MKPKHTRPDTAPVALRMEGYEMIEKVAMPSGTTARILVPRHWIGKKIRAVRVEP